ncbi:MAG: hypothetical protein RR653_09000, partial [Clostridia bacterium]
MARRKRFERTQQHAGYNIGKRYLIFLVAIVGAFSYLLVGVFNLQLRSSEEYQQKAETRRTTKITLRGSRGMITDADAVILANDESVYNVTFYRDASQRTKAEYAAFTESIRQTIEIIEGGGNELSVHFVIERNPSTGEWAWNFGSGVSEAVLQTREN